MPVRRQLTVHSTVGRRLAVHVTAGQRQLAARIAVG
jgi:hypothetical protein